MFPRVWREKLSSFATPLCSGAIDRLLFLFEVIVSELLTGTPFFMHQAEH
jgi:hypothetical protein